MQHHVIYWAFGKREADVDDEELVALRRRQDRGEIYLEFVDGDLRRLTWDGERHRWVPSSGGSARTPSTVG